MTTHRELVDFITDISKENLSFTDKVVRLQATLGEWDQEKLVYFLSHTGMIPEQFDHDSSEEKLYAKYCDVVVHAFFQLMGHSSELVAERRDASVKNKILEYFRTNVGKRVMNEELRYVAGNKTEWARRVRELRTEDGWPIFTKQTGRPDVDVGEYVLEAGRQSFVHDRRITDPVRRDVLKRDAYGCTNCGWHQEEWSTADPRFLELHHIRAHAEGGENIPENLTTLCNVCHDEAHRD